MVTVTKPTEEQIKNAIEKIKANRNSFFKSLMSDESRKRFQSAVKK